MTSQEILNNLLIIGSIVIIVCIAYVTYFLIKALKSITNLLNSLNDTTQSVKNKIQMRSLIAIPALIVALASKVFKKGR